MAHPTLGQPPTDFFAAHPDAAERLRANTDTIAARALEHAVRRDPTMKDRYDELALRHLLRDAGVALERIALCVASGKDTFVADWTEWVAPTYRKRKVPMDDLINLSEGLRLAIRAFLGPDEMAIADRGIDNGIANLRWNRRIAGDARKRNKLLQLIYKGA